MIRGALFCIVCRMFGGLLQGLEPNLDWHIKKPSGCIVCISVLGLSVPVSVQSMLSRCLHFCLMSCMWPLKLCEVL